MHHIIKDEIDMLYAASNKLAQASVAAEQLEAVSDYAREQGASSAVLMSIESDSEGNPETLEIVAEWSTGKAIPFGVGTRFKHGGIRAWTANPNRPTMIQDVGASDLVETQRNVLLERHIRACVLLPLNVKGRWVGVIIFNWNESYFFDERDQRVFTAIIQQTAPVIDSMRLYEQSRERAARAELLLEINTTLFKSTSEHEILSAIAPYASRQGAFLLRLNYFETDEAGQPIEGQTVAAWKDGAPWMDDPALSKPRNLRNYTSPRLWSDYPQALFLIEDVTNDTRLDIHFQTYLLADDIQALALIPLHSNARWQGSLVIHWKTPHPFSEEELYVYNALIQTASPMVGTRRAYLAEGEAREESELLYWASEAINDANSFAEIAQAVANLDSGPNTVALTIWENYEFDTASYFEVVATSSGNPLPVGKRYSLVDDFPIVYNMPRRGVWVIENIAEDPRIDEVSASSWIREGTRARIGVALSRNNRWMGNLAFHSPVPRTYTEKQKRLIAGIGDLVTAALERMRLQAETVAARQRAEMLAQVNAALSQAADEDGVLAAVAGLVERYGVDDSSLSYAIYDEQNEVTKLRLVGYRHGDGLTADLAGLAPVELNIHDFPLLKMAYINPYAPIFVEDVNTDPREIIVQSRDIPEVKKWPAVIGLPLQTNELWHGILIFRWEQPQTFTTDIRELFKAIMPNAASVVARRRLQAETEMARQRAETLAQINAALSQATDEQAILGAIAKLVERFGVNFSHLSYIIDTDEDNYPSQVEIVALRSGEGEALPLSTLPMTVYPTSAYPSLQVAYRNPDQVFYVEDMNTDQRPEVQRANQMSRVIKWKATVAIPLKVGDQWQGTITFLWLSPQKFTAEMLSTFASIQPTAAAVVARRRLQTETEAARRRAETLAQVNAALSQATDEQGILAAVALLAERYGVALSHLSYFDPENRVNIVAMRSGDGRRVLPSILPVTAFRPDDYPFLNLIYNSPNEPTFIEDVQNDPRTEAGNTRRFCQSVNWSAIIMISLKTGEQLQGMLTLVWRDQQIFDREMRDLFQAIVPALISVVATRRAYLAEGEARRETEMRAHEIETVAKVSAASATILDVDDLINTVSRLAKDSFELHHVHIYLLDELESQLLLAPRTDVRGHQNKIYERHIPLKTSEHLVARAARQREAIIINDARQENLLTVDNTSPETRSQMAVPMIVGDNLIGVLDIHSVDVQRFSETNRRVMTTLADQIAVAIQNARLYQQAQEVAALEERHRLARELHDSVSQALYGIALGSKTARILLDRDPSRVAEPLEYVLSLAEAGLTEMRALIFELRPESLENEGLVTALSKQASSVQTRHGINMQIDLGEEPQLPLEIKEALYRIAREAMHNMVKHAKATQASLRMHCEDDFISVEVVDNGVGFDPQGLFPGHLGLHSMRERAQKLQGEIVMESAPGQGTRVMVCIPHRQISEN
jgi:signal transduction histidine kinase